MNLKSAALRVFSPDLHPNTISAMWSFHEARNKLGAVVEAAVAGKPQVISRSGHPAVVVVSASSYEQLLAEARQARGSFVDHLLAMPSEACSERVVRRAQVEPRDVGL